MKQSGRVLFVSSFNPMCATSGAAIRAGQMLQFLRTRYHVDVVFEGHGDREVPAPLPDGIDRVETVAPVARTRVVSALFSSLPYHHAMVDQGGFGSTIRRLSARGRYSFVWMTKTWMYPAVRRVLPTVPVFLEQQAAEHDVWANLAQSDPRWYVRWYSRWNGRKVSAFEQSIYPDLAGAICISEEDRVTTIARYPRIPLLVVPMGIDCNYYRNSTDGADPHTLLFSGTDATRNVDAMTRFVTRIAPLLRGSNPRFRLLWIGSVRTERLKFLPHPEVEVTGYVEHVPVHFARGAIFIAPFDMGEGVKVKIVEALAMGKVIVSTKVGVRGLGLEGLPFVKIVDDDHGFAKAIRGFAEDSGLRAHSDAARQYAEHHFGFEGVMSSLPEFIESSLQSARGRWGK